MNSVENGCLASLILLISNWSFQTAHGADPVSASAPASAPRQPLLEQALAGALKDVSEVIFCTRLGYDDPHWYANIGYYCENDQRKAYTGNGKPEISRLYKWNVRSGATAVLLDPAGGSIRDPQVHYEGEKILFSYRKTGTDFYHLYEVQVDGVNLRQLTFGAFDDYEPTYLPDGGIAFVSTRCQRWVNCWTTQVGVIYRCDGDGTHVRLLSANTEHDNTPWVLPDGRLLYTRWEYVDRSQVEFHHLWTMNPDGTGATVFYGNMRPNIVMIDAKPVPGTDKVVASFSPGHGVTEHAGIATLLTSTKGPDAPAAAHPLHQGKLTRDPYPLTENCVLAARDNELVLLDGSGRTEVLYRHSGPGLLHEPRPLVSRPREALIPSRTEPREPTGRMVLADVYRGRNLPGVKRGDIKKLLLLESLPKQVNFSGGPDLISWLGTFTLERVLGTVPVEEDGSAYFEVPAERQVFFVALDDQDLSVKRMQSFTSAMPGEVVGCVGCHEPRIEAPANRSAAPLQALRRPPSKIQRFNGLPDVLDFPRDIQPILDRHCVGCHSTERREGGVLLVGDLGPTWSLSFFSLFAHRQVADGRNGLGNQPPRTIGSSASALLKKVDGSHYQIKVSPQEWRTLWLWIESGAPYAGTYAALRNEHTQSLPGAALGQLFGTQGAVLQRRCFSCHSKKAKPDGSMSLPFDEEARRQNRGGLRRPMGAYERIVVEHDPVARFGWNALFNFTRPAQSPLLLGPLAKEAGGFGSCGTVFKDPKDPDYQSLLAAIERGKAILDAEPRYATANFRPNAQYLREMKKYGIVPNDFDPTQQPVDVYELDQKYWRASWYNARAEAESR